MINIYLLLIPSKHIIPYSICFLVRPGYQKIIAKEHSAFITGKLVLKIKKCKIK